jgi:zinc transporter, ZIP family
MEAILIIALLAIAGPIVGSLLGVLRKPTDTFMFNLLSFAAGVMLAISFLDLIPESIRVSSTLLCAIGFLAGAVIMFSVDRVLPHVHPALCEPENEKASIQKTASFLLAGIFIHNIPEGMAIGIVSALDIRASLAIAVAIAIQKIPEGICTSAPYYYATGDRRKAFLVSSLTAIPVLIGFIIAYFLSNSIPMEVVGIMIAATAGFMTYISADELIPSSSCRLTHHSTIFSLIAGIILVIALGALHSPL